MRVVSLPLSVASILVLAATFAQAGLVYVDAQADNTMMALLPDGPVYQGTPLVTAPDSNNADGMWRLRPGFGLAADETTIPDAPYDSVANGGDLLESGDWHVTDNAPRLRTSVTGLPMNTYDVYAYFWDAEGGVGWNIRAGLQDTAGTDSLTLYRWDSPNVIKVTDDGKGYDMFQIYLGTLANVTAIDVFVEDLPATRGSAGGSTDRTWFDGFAYVPEPSTLGLIGIFGAVLLARRRR